MKNIMLINDVCAVGNCSMVTNLSVFSHFGHYCMPLVTATYSCNTAFGDFMVVKNNRLQQFANQMINYRNPDVVYVGFCNEADTLCEVINALSKCNDNTLIIVDPIMGDNGKLYTSFDDRYVAQMKQLASKAYCITPNLTEACLLLDVDYSSVVSHSNEPAFLGYCGKLFADICKKLGCKNAVITGVVCQDLVGNVVIEDGKVSFVTNEYINKQMQGTGDLFSSIVTAKIIEGESLLKSTQLAADFVCKAVQTTCCDDGRYGTEFNKILHIL